jgi:hypothetical protein
MNVMRELQELSPDLPADVLTEDELEAELLNMLDRHSLADAVARGSLDAGVLAVSGSALVVRRPADYAISTGPILTNKSSRYASGIVVEPPVLFGFHRGAP